MPKMNPAESARLRRFRIDPRTDASYQSPYGRSDDGLPIAWPKATGDVGVPLAHYPAAVRHLPEVTEPKTVAEPRTWLRLSDMASELGIKSGKGVLNRAWSRVSDQALGGALRDGRRKVMCRMGDDGFELHRNEIGWFSRVTGIPVAVPVTAQHVTLAILLTRPFFSQRAEETTDLFKEIAGVVKGGGKPRLDGAEVRFDMTKTPGNMRVYAIHCDDVVFLAKEVEARIERAEQVDQAPAGP